MNLLAGWIENVSGMYVGSAYSLRVQLVPAGAVLIYDEEQLELCRMTPPSRCCDRSLASVIRMHCAN